MKKYLSVFEMFSRSSLYKVLVVSIVMAVVQFGSFYMTMQNYNGMILTELVEKSYLSWIWKIAYILVTIVIVLPSCNIGSVQNYTFGRLRIKEKRVYLLQSIYNTLCYVLLWMTEVVVLWVTSAYYLRQTTTVLSNQTLFLEFYKSPMLHSILPLEDILGWILLIYFFVGTGFAAEMFCRRQRSGKLSFELIVMAVLMILLFPRALGGSLLVFIIPLIVIPIQFVYRRLLDGEVAEHETK